MLAFVFSMLGKEFFVGRYRRLGWEFREASPRQAIRVNVMNVDGVDVVGRLRNLGVELEKVPFLQNGYWVVRSDFSVGATVEYLLVTIPFRRRQPRFQRRFSRI